MTERKITYTVEIDASQAQAAARVLRAIFERELRSVSAGIGGGQGGGGLAATMAEAQRPAAAMKKALEEMGRVDLTKPADALLAQLGELDNALRRTRTEYERLSTLAGSQRRPGSGANQADYVRDVRNQVGDAAANAMAHTGRSLNIGQRGAEFKVDEEGYYLQAEKDFIQAGDARTEKMRFTLEEKQQLARLEMEMYEAELQAVRIQRELGERRLGALEKQMNGAELTASNANIFEEADRVQQETIELGQQEADLLRSISGTNDRLGELMEQQQQAISRQAARSGQIVGASPGQAGGVAMTQQTALTVSARSVENAKQLAAAMQEAAEATQRMEATRTSANVRSFELDMEREKAKLRQQAAIETTKLSEMERVSAAQRVEMEKSAGAAQREQIRIAGAEARAESGRRVALARGEAVAIGEAAKTARAVATEEERRHTAEYKAELQKQILAAQQASQKKSGGGLPFGMSGTSLAYGAAAALGIYSVDQVVRQGLDWGVQGARQMRMAETFEAMAQRTGQSSQKLVAAIRQASQETITDMDAMGLAAQVLAQKWAGSITTLDTDMATVVAASRRYSQIYTDEQGKMLTTQEIFARMIKYAREGNKELVDQFGISNSRIADSLGITVQGLASAGGATDRWRGLVQVLNEDLTRLGSANITTADKIEQSASRIEAARQRIQQALAKPTAYVYETAANLVDPPSLTFQNEQRNIEALRQQVESQRGGLTQLLWPQEEGAIDEKSRRVEMLATALQQVTAAQADGVAEADQYAQALSQEIERALQFGEVTDAQVILLQQIADWSANAAAEVSGLGDASADTTNWIDALSDATDGMTGDLRALAWIAASAGADIDSLGDAVEGLRQRMAGALAPLAEFNAESQRVGGALMSQAQRAVELVGPQRAGELLQQQLAGFEEIQAGLRRTGVTAGPEMQLTMEEALLQLSQPFTDIQEAERARIEAQREWERAGEKAQKDFEAAAEKMVEEFKSGLQQVPGLFGTSGVTEDQMQLAGAGVGQNFADDYLRRLKDEVSNKHDWEGVDVQDAARRAGIDPGLPAEMILKLFEQAWSDQSLFAGGQNLDLINREAVQANLARQDASRSGQAALLAAFGVPTEPGVQLAQFAGGAGQLSGAPGEPPPVGVQPVQSPALLAGVAPLDGAAMLEEMTKAMEAGLDGNIKDRLYAIGEGIVASVHQGFSDAVANLEWGGQIIDNLAAALVGPLFDALSAEL